jgi:mRNA interferase RelE/StbE
VSRRLAVVVSDQVAAYVRRLAPDPRRVMRNALRDLASGKGDVRQLEAPLDGYYRLRVGPHRVILAHGPRRRIECVFAERRSLVYEVFARELAARFLAPTER